MEYTIRPEEHELREARQVVQAALEASRTRAEREEDLSVELGWTDEEYVKTRMDGVSGQPTGIDSFQLRFNTSVDGWKDSLKATTAHEYAHTWFLEKKGEISFNWEYVLLEAHGQIFAEELFPGIETPWRKSFDRSELEEHWPAVREELDEEVDWEHLGLFYGSEQFPEWLGYSVAYMIGRKLLEEHGLEELAELKLSDVKKAGDEALG